MNLVFMGTPEFAVPSLARLVDDGHRIAAVVTAPEKKRGRGQKVSDTPVGAFARLTGLPVHRPSDVSDPGFHEMLAALAPDIIVVVAFRILPETMFSIPAKGIFNLHASLLPRYRGAAPIQWAILNGESETGVTTFLLARRVDTGGILLQEKLEIGATETAGQLHDRLARLGADVVSRTVALLATGSPTPKPQDESRASHARKVRKEDMRIDWSQPADSIHNRIRAFAPEPGAWTSVEGKTLKIFAAKPDAAGDAQQGAPGEILRVTKDECVVGCGAGTLSLFEVMLEGRKRLPIPEFLRGYRLEQGTVLGAVGSLPGA